MLTRARLYDLIAYEDFDARDKIYFGLPEPQNPNDQ
jgi:hypothetical protein